MFETLQSGIMSPPEPREVEWCDECDDAAYLCDCNEDDPDRAYEEMRDRMMERNDA